MSEKTGTMSWKDVLTVSPKELVTGGYLQEANRLFFHPLGLALTLVHDEKTDEASLCVYDFRDDPEGMVFGDQYFNDPDPLKKARNIEQERAKFASEEPQL